MAPKKKQQKLALVDFFAETPSGGSWADEDVSLPSAPAKKEPGAQAARGSSGYLDSMPDRGSRMDSGFSGPPREELPVPTVPPFTAFVGNLTFETDDEAVKEHLGPGITSVRLVKDPMNGKPKGYGYVEYGSQGELKVALGKNMTSLGGRTIRVSVAEPPTGRRDAPSAAETASEWRRSGPIPARDAPQARRNDSFGGAPRDSEAGPPRDLDWGAARGAKFSPAPAGNDFRRDSSGGGVPREGREGRESTQFGSGLADNARQWRSDKPPAIAVEGRAGSGQSSPGLAPGLADTESTWTRASKLRTPIDTPPVSSPTGEEANKDWRGSRAPSAAASVAGDSPQAPAAPVERRKLNLAPRSQATGDAAPTSGSSSSIFGSAKPIDTATREAETFAKRQEERKKAQEERAKALKEEDDKIKAEADARAKSITDARDAAIREAGGVPPSAAPAKKPQGQGQGQQGQGPRGGPGGPGGRQNSNGPHGHGHGHGQGQNRPARGGRTNSNQAQKTEDGFEVAKGSRRDNNNREEQAAAQAQAKKDAPVRKGFSFAAAAGLVEDTEGDEKEDESEDLSKRLAEVKV